MSVENNIVRDIDGAGLPQWESMEGIVVFGGDAADAVTNITVRDNLVENINGRATEGGAAGIRVQGNADIVSVLGNEVRDIGEGATTWAFGIAVSGTGNHGETPRNVTLENNTIADIVSNPATATVGVGLGLESPSDAVTVTGNSVSNAAFLLEDKDAGGVKLSAAELQTLIADNTFDQGAYVTNPDGSIDSDPGAPVIVYASIQAAVEAADAGDTINVLAGTYDESVTVDKALSFQGAGSGSTIVEPTSGSGFDIVGDLGTDAAVSIDGIGFRNAPGAGVDFDDNAILGTLTITNSAFETNDANGVRIGGNYNPVDLDNVVIENSTFTGNGQPSGSSGDGDILFFQYNGDATLRDLFIIGQDRDLGPAENGLQFRGDSGALGNVTLENVTIAGVYEKQPFAFFNYDDVSGLSATNVSVIADSANWDISGNFDGIGGDIDFAALGIDTTGAPDPVAVQGDGTANDLTSGVENAILNGHGGDDSLTGGSGFDALQGGAGNDTLRGDANADRFVFADGFGEDRIVDFAVTNDAEKIDLSGVSTIAGFADLVSNHLSEDGSDAVITASTGDVLRLTGVDIADLDPADFVFASSLTAERGDAGVNDSLVGTAGEELLRGYSGFDTLAGGEGDDVLRGDFNADTFVFADGFGQDVIVDFEATNDLETIDLSAVTSITDFSDLSDNHLSQGDAGAVITASGNTITLLGVDDADLDAADFTFGETVLGAAGTDDNLIGGPGNDSLRGYSGFDTLEGGAGNDTLRGGFNADRFVFADGFGEDRIEDFAATNDAEKIDLSGVSAITDFTDLAANHLSEDGSDAVITASTSDVLHLTGVDIFDLGPDDFIF